MKKLSIMIIIAFLIMVSGCTNVAKNNSLPPATSTKIEEGIIIMAYTKPADFAYFEVYVSTTASFNPKGWNGSAWTGEPNDPADWDGSADYNLHTRTANEPITMTTKLIPYTLYYARVVAVDTSGNRSDPGAEESARAGDKQRASTLVVAASDAAAASKAGADYVCEVGSTDNETEINTALTALPQIVIEGGTAQTGASTTITLRSTAGDVDDQYNGLQIFVTGGLGSGQSKTITDYVGSTKVATIDSAWATNPDNTSTYEIRSRVGKVLLTEGTFTVNSSIVLYSNTTLEGSGNGTIIKVKDGKNATLNVIINSDTTIGNFNISVKNLNIDGNKANNSSGGQTCVLFNKASTCIIEKLNTSNSRGSGVSFTDGNKNNVSKINAHNNNGHGIYIMGSNNRITENSILNNTLGGIFIDASSNNIIEGNTCRGTKNNPGINLYNGSDYNTLNGNVCSENRYEGIMVDGDFNTLIGNNCGDNLKDGLYLIGANDNIVNNNILTNNGQLTNNAYSNLFVFGSDRNSIQGNTCRKGTATNKAKYGIRVEESSSVSNLISNNDCYTGGETNGISNAGTSTSFGAGNRNNDGSFSTTPN